MVLESQDLAAQLAEMRAKVVGVAPVAEALGKLALHGHRLLGQRFQPPLVLNDRIECRLHSVISHLYLFIQLGKNTAIRQTATIKRIPRQRRRIRDDDAQALQPVVRCPHVLADSAERISQFLQSRGIAGRLRKLVADGGDAFAILAYLFDDEIEPACMDAADANDDGAVDISDAIYLFNGTTPSAPGPDAVGSDPTPDDLDCHTYAG